MKAIWSRQIAGSTSEAWPVLAPFRGLPGPTRLDLYGRYLSFVWNYSTGEPRDGQIAGTTELRLDIVGRGHRVLSRAHHGDGEAYASCLDPNGYRGRIFYGFGRAEIREGADFGLSALLLNERISTGGRKLSDRRLDGFPIDTAADTTPSSPRSTTTSSPTPAVPAASRRSAQSSTQSESPTQPS